MTSETNLKDLKAEIQQLRAQVSELTALTTLPSSNMPASIIVPDSASNQNLPDLKTEVEKLQKEVSVMSVKHQYSPPVPRNQQETRPKPQPK